MLILGIDTSEKNINIALAESRQIICEIEENNNKTEELINYLDRMFKDNGKAHSDLGAIGVITGPGGYTGTRSGVAVAKTMSQFLKIPLIGVNKLEAIVLCSPENEVVAPMIDVKRDEVFAGIAMLNNGEITYLVEPAVFNVQAWVTLLKAQQGPVKLLASELKKRPELFADLRENITVDFQFYFKPSHITKITAAFIEAGKGKSFIDVSPFYIRDAI